MDADVVLIETPGAEGQPIYPSGSNMTETQRAAQHSDRATQSSARVSGTAMRLANNP